MALDPLELGVIALMGIAVFIWGPEKVPEIAKQIATARKQLDVYTKQLNGITKELQTSMTTGNIDNLSNVLTSVGVGVDPGPTASNPSTEEIARATAGSPSSPGLSPATATPATAMPAPMLLSPAAVMKNPAILMSSPPPVVKSGDQLLLEMAKQLGIATQGKTRDDIQNEILACAAQPTDSTDSTEAQTAPTSPPVLPADAPTAIPEVVPAQAAA
jgi:Sec-independent protein translocase protein TatA